jgi:CarboxypepD_reg-like domain/TonB-dependent Receptor Plug Domain
MNFRKTILAFALMICSMQIMAQQKHTISGIIKDKKNGETIIGATITIAELANVGTKTNTYGFYSITIPEGNYEIKISSTGFKTETQSINLNKDLKLDLELEKANTTIKEIKITGAKKDRNVKDAQMGLEKLNMAEIAKVPVLMGEKDIIKTMTLLPGIKSAGEGGGGINVRGGAVDQNLILLDEAPVYNASHLLGFFSTFNSDAIKDVQIYKGGMPAQYGGRLSSVLDIKMKEGNNKKFNVSGGLGIIASRINIEGPIVKEKGSFLISARRTYVDQFLRFAPDTNIRKAQLYFYDINAKANYKINENNRIYLSGYFGRDKIGIANQFGIGWGNATGTARWSHIINSKWFSNTSLIYSKYNYKIGIRSTSTDFDITSKIQDINLKHEVSYFANPKNTIKFGANIIKHTMLPGQLTTTDTTINAFKLQDRYSYENAIYVSNEWKPTTKLSINYGLRATDFMAIGKGDFYTFDNKGKATDTTNYKAGEVVKNYFNLEPRFSASYLLQNNNSIKAAYARNIQNLHYISNSTSSTPTDLWIASSINVKPEISDQISAGYFQNFDNNNYEFSVETYYKSMRNQIDYRDGANTQANDKIEGELLYGIGRAYGIEFLLKKKTGRFTGWASYTFARTEKKIDGINSNNWYAAKQDKTHDISLVGIYDLTSKWSLSSTWVYNTGNAVTFPSGKYYVNNQVQYLYTERNGYRLPAYHRMDFGATYTKKKSENRESSWNFSLYNVYGRENVYTITFKEDPKDATKTQAVRTALFRWVPSITYNFKF